MSDRPKIIKQQSKPLPPELRRLVCSFKSVMVRKYPDPQIRASVSEIIMDELKRNFSLAQTQDVV